ncbi:hypothetical protein KC363_g3489 [Hortaea werneckii]|uniref:Uncharacterized protein n=1 Tax=Hortaea werneckii TaxID=91943 RepID=A0A3M7FL54_HORWE|nr:hypothetical protein KC363_g3489 [Hortaea werneckii]KAI7512449.1 hypothetical protein KC347_g2471 [Hortaea werneckii]RMY89512.1 hypothetical protein D0861_04198 [Hortaea werneckii]
MPEMRERTSHPTSAVPAAAAAAAATTSTDSPDEQESDPHQPVSIPPWVHNYDSASADDAHLLQPPQTARPNTRHYKLPPAHYKPGRKWDHLRSPSPPLLSTPIPDHQARWRPFMYSGPTPHEQEERARVVDQAWLDKHMPALGEGWKEEDDMRADGEPIQTWSGRGLMYKGRWLISPERQERSVRLFWRLLLKNPFVPLAFRVAVLAFAAASLGVAARLYQNINHANKDQNADNQCATRASTYMAICVGAIAMPYLGYITWDEYMSKPLGLRSASTKTLLLLCDLYFVVFAASNLSLAFDALYDRRWACYGDNYVILQTGEGNATNPVYNVPATCPNNQNICYHQKSLSGVLFVSLIAWLMTFSISVMRVVEKLRPD